MAATSMTSQRLVLLTFPPDGDGKTCDVPLASANMSLSGEPWSGEPGLEGIIVEPGVRCIDVHRWSRDFVEYAEVPGGERALLSLGDVTVSRDRHARIYWCEPDSRWLVLDRSSLNGTWVILGDNQFRVRQPYPLGLGQHDLRIGGCKLVVFVEKNPQ